MPRTQNSIVPVKKGKTYNPRGSGNLPFPREQLRQELLEAAGFDQKEKIRLLEKTLHQLNLALTAEKIEYLTHQGEIIKIIRNPDWKPRLSAIQTALELLDTNRGKNEGGSSAPVTFVINAPDWEQPEPAVIVEGECKEIEEKNSVCREHGT